MEIRKRIEQPVTAEFQRFQEEFIKSLSSPTLKLQSAIDRIMLSTGKYIRPLLVLLTAKTCGQINEVTINSSILLELLHTASLIHDDVIDETKQRRGQPSLNAIFDNRISVLVGDYVLSSALIRSIQTGNMQIISIVSQVGRALSEGEIHQLEVIEDTLLDEKSYMQIVKSKTAMLLSACTEIGAISVGAPEEYVNYFRQIGEYLGYCFQIKDDIFDYFSNEKLGKPTGNDIVEGKVTLPLLYAIHKDKSPETLQYCEIIKNKDFTHKNVVELIRFAKEKGGIEYAESRMKEYHDKAVFLIEKMPHNEARSSLLLLADYIVSRNK